MDPDPKFNIICGMDWAVIRLYASLITAQVKSLKILGTVDVINR